MIYVPDKYVQGFLSSHVGLLCLLPQLSVGIKKRCEFEVNPARLLIVKLVVMLFYFITP